MFLRQLPEFDITGFEHDLESETEVRRFGISAWLLAGMIVVGSAIAACGSAGWIDDDSWLLALGGMLVFFWPPSAGIYFLHRRYRGLSCRTCLEKMDVGLTDLRHATRPTTRELDGRFYGRPNSNSNTRPWVRYMMRIWACQRCQCFVWSGSIHDTDCDDETSTLLTETYGSPLQELFELTKEAFELPERLENPPEDREAFLAKFRDPELTKLSQ